jgi:hypothetical protein
MDMRGPVAAFSAVRDELHLNDNCVLILFPRPFAGCGIGKRKANGDLFEHMHDPARSDAINETT